MGTSESRPGNKIGVDFRIICYAICRGFNMRQLYISLKESRELLEWPTKEERAEMERNGHPFGGGGGYTGGGSQDDVIKNGHAHIKEKPASVAHHGGGNSGGMRPGSNYGGDENEIWNRDTSDYDYKGEHKKSVDHHKQHLPEKEKESAEHLAKYKESQAKADEHGAKAAHHEAEFHKAKEASDKAKASWFGKGKAKEHEAKMAEHGNAYNEHYNEKQKHSIAAERHKQKHDETESYIKNGKAVIASYKEKYGED